MSSTNQVTKITTIIQVMRSGVEFYEDALRSVDNPLIINIFFKMVKTKNAIIESLQPYAILEQGEREGGGSFAIDTRKFYAKVATAFTSNTNHSYVDQLEEVEDKVLEVIDDAIKDNKSDATLKKLYSVKTECQRMHHQMKTLQEATES